MRQMDSIDKGHCIVGPDISSETETTNLPEDWCHPQGSLSGQFFLLPSRTFVITHHKMVGSRSMSTCLVSLVKTLVTAAGRSAGQEPGSFGQERHMLASSSLSKLALWSAAFASQASLQ